jgi:hypothetical protein
MAGAAGQAGGGHDRTFMPRTLKEARGYSDRLTESGRRMGLRGKKLGTLISHRPKPGAGGTRQSVRAPSYARQCPRVLPRTRTASGEVLGLRFWA